MRVSCVDCRSYMIFQLIQLLHHKPSGLPAHLHSDRPVPSHPDPHPCAGLYHARELPAEPFCIPYPRAAIPPHILQLISVRLGDLHSRRSTRSVGINHDMYAMIIRLIGSGTNRATFRVLFRIPFILSRYVTIMTCLSSTNIFQISCHESRCRSVATSGPLPLDRGVCELKRTPYCSENFHKLIQLKKLIFFY